MSPHRPDYLFGKPTIEHMDDAIAIYHIKCSRTDRRARAMGSINHSTLKQKKTRAMNKRSLANSKVTLAQLSTFNHLL